MSTTLDELERMLRLVLADQRRLAEVLIAHREAMRSLSSGAMEKLAGEAAALRQRVAATEPRRRLVTQAAARELGITAQDVTLTMLAEKVPDPARRTRMLALRDELRAAVGDVANASHVAGRLAGAVLGHLNSAMRVISGAMQGGTSSGAYTRTGSPRLGGRLGAIEAVG